MACPIHSDNKFMTERKSKVTIAINLNRQSTIIDPNASVMTIDPVTKQQVQSNVIAQGSNTRQLIKKLYDRR